MKNLQSLNYLVNILPQNTSFKSNDNWLVIFNSFYMKVVSTSSILEIWAFIFM